MSYNYSQDALKFQLLQSVCANVDHAVEELQPKDFDKLSQEVAMAYERTSMPESNECFEERQVSAIMCGTIGTIENRLSQLAEGDSKAGAMLMLFRKSISTPNILRSLLKMSDPTIRTGQIYCHTSWHLSVLCGSVRNIWEMKMPNSSNTFATEVMIAMAERLQHTGDVRHVPNCACRDMTWDIFDQGLGICLEDPKKVVDILEPYDWQFILQRGQQEPTVSPVDGTKSFHDMYTLVGLHRWPVQVLQKDSSNQKSISLLQKLGSCSLLLRRVLTRVVSGEIWTPGDEFDELVRIINFMESYMNCLTPLPSCDDDEELDALIKRTCSILSEKHRIMMSLDKNHTMFANIDSPNISVESGLRMVKDLVSQMQRWKKLAADETDADRIQRFSVSRLAVCGADSKNSSKGLAKHLKKLSRKRFKEQTNLKDGEMCACCFVFEKQLLREEGRSLLKCAQCKKVKYCSRECQRKHWKKAHKTMCKQFASNK